MAAKKTRKPGPRGKTSPAKKASRPGRTRARAPRDPLERVRAICLAFPEAHEVTAWGEPTFRVKNKMFAMYASANTHHGGGRPAVWINSTHVEQDLVLRAKPSCYFKPPYAGPAGWIGSWLDAVADWDEIEMLLRDGYRLRAPAKLAAQLED